MLFDLSVMSGFAEWTCLVCECDTYGSTVFRLFFLCCVLCFVVASPRGVASVTPQLRFNPLQSMVTNGLSSTKTHNSSLANLRNTTFLT